MEERTETQSEQVESSGAHEGPPRKKDRKQSLQLILDIPLQVTVELGRTKMLVNDLLQLTQGSVVELSKMAGEPLDVLVNNKAIARGEVVMINEKFGIRIIEILSPMERVEQLT
jgi:flagellar motor switch protein FliN/FliY